MVTWQPPLTPNGMIRGYQVNYFVLGGRIETVDTDTLSTLLTGLSSYVNYTIFVRARTVNLGTNSTFVMASTNEDGKHLLLVTCTAIPGTSQMPGTASVIYLNKV